MIYLIFIRYPVKYQNKRLIGSLGILGFNQLENRRSRDIQNQVFNQILRKIQTAHCGYKDQTIGIMGIHYPTQKLQAQKHIYLYLSKICPSL